MYKNLLNIRPKYRAFSAEETGSLTIHGLFTFMAMATVSAISLDVSNLMSSQTQLQVAADAAGHAALYYRDMHTPEEAKAAAIIQISASMPSEKYGEILAPEDIIFGNWDYDTETFAADPASRSAVQVTTARVASRSNSVASFLFKIVGYDTFDVVTSAVFTTFRPTCFREGFVADGIVDIQSNNAYANGFCVHSNTYVSMNTNNTFEAGTVISMPDMDNIDLPRSGYETNEGLQAALRSGVYRLRILNRIDYLIDGLEDGNPDLIPDYITSTAHVTLTDGQLDETDFIPGRIHVHACTNKPKITLSPSVPLSNIILIANCEVKFGASTILEDVIIATRDTSSLSINSPASLQVGRDDGCMTGGGTQIITKGSMNFAADLKIFGGQLLALQDIEFSANASGIEGASMVAGGTISGTSNMSMAFCGAGMESNFEAEYFRLAL